MVGFLVVRGMIGGDSWKTLSVPHEGKFSTHYEYLKTSNHLEIFQEVPLETGRGPTCKYETFDCSVSK